MSVLISNCPFAFPTFGFQTTWGWENDDRIFGWIILYIFYFIFLIEVITPCKYTAALLRLLHGCADKAGLIDGVEKRLMNEPTKGAIDPTHHRLFISLITSITACQCGTVGRKWLSSCQHLHQLSQVHVYCGGTCWIGLLCWGLCCQ